MESLSQAPLLYNSYPCLLGAWRGFCSYYGGQPIYFSLGEAVSALGLIFAVYQLKKPIWDIRLAIHKWVNWAFWIFALLGIVSIFLSAIVANIPIGYIPDPFGLSFFYEILGFIFFVISPFLLFFFGTVRKNFFDRFNAERFYWVVLKNTFITSDKTLEAPVDILRENLSRLLNTIFIGKDNQNANQNPTKRQYASAVFNHILTEDKVIDYIVTQRIDFLFSLFEELKRIESMDSKNYRLYSIEIRGAINKITEKLLKNPESFLYKQLHGYQGHSYVANLYELIFADYDLIKPFKPFTNVYDRLVKKHQPGAIAVFIRALEKAVESYFSVERKEIDNYTLTQAFRSLDDYMEGICFAVVIKNLSFKDIEPDLREIADFYGHKFPQLLEKATIDKKIYSLDSDKDDVLNSGGLSGVYANSLFEFMKNLSVLELNKEEESSLSFHVDQAMWSFIHLKNPNKILELTLKLIWKHIEEHKTTFPAILKIYLLFLPWWREKTDDWEEVEKQKAKEWLSGLKDSFKKKQKMGLSGILMERVLLPKTMTYSKAKNKIYFTNRFGKKSIVI